MHLDCRAKDLKRDADFVPHDIDGRSRQDPATRWSVDPELFRVALAAAPTAMIVVDADGRIVLANRAVGELLGFDTDELIGQPVEMLVPLESRASHTGQRASYVQNPSRRPMGSQRDLRAATREGETIQVEIGLSPVETSNGPLVVCSIVDISGRERAAREAALRNTRLARKNEMLLETVLTDPLTSLGNRQAFMDHLNSQLEAAVRHARPLSVLILDIDHFKAYNDTFGHLAGDEALILVAGLLEKAARRSDFVGRLGGEEFGVILPETDKPGACIIAERIRETVENAEWPRRPITASLGAMTVEFDQSVPRPAAPEIAVILGAADRALYWSKEHGRNRVTHAQEMDRGDHQA